VKQIEMSCSAIVISNGTFYIEPQLDGGIARIRAHSSCVPPFEDVTSYSLLKEKLADVLMTLTDRERKILEMRFGLVDGYERTLEEIGKMYNVTRERIRQIEAKALAKLRKHKDARKLHDYIK